MLARAVPNPDPDRFATHAVVDDVPGIGNWITSLAATRCRRTNTGISENRGKGVLYALHELPCGKRILLSDAGERGQVGLERPRCPFKPLFWSGGAHARRRSPGGPGAGLRRR